MWGQPAGAVVRGDRRRGWLGTQAWPSAGAGLCLVSLTGQARPLAVCDTQVHRKGKPRKVRPDREFILTPQCAIGIRLRPALWRPRVTPSPRAPARPPQRKYKHERCVPQWAGLLSLYLLAAGPAELFMAGSLLLDLRSRNRYNLSGNRTLFLSLPSRNLSPSPAKCLTVFVTRRSFSFTNRYCAENKVTRTSISPTFALKSHIDM